MTTREILALVEILNRAPATQAEKIWLEEVLNREIAEAQAREKASTADDHAL